MVTKRKGSAGVRAARADKQRQDLERLSAEASDDVLGIEVRPHNRTLQVRWTPDAYPLVSLVALDRLRRQHLAGLEAELVVHARSEGVSWESIGWALGITRAAVQKRHPEADAQVTAMLRGGEV